MPVHAERPLVAVCLKLLNEHPGADAIFAIITAYVADIVQESK
jgi:hypothetical protein